MSRKLLLVGLILAACGCNSQSGGGANRSGAEEPRGVILLRYTPGSESTTQREEGFLDYLQKHHPDIPILSSDQYSGTTPESSLDKAQQLLIKYEGRIEGVFAVCEPNANGVLGALKEAGVASEVKFVGFDPNERMVQAMREGEMSGIVLQDPVTIGYRAVKTLVAHLEGEQVEKRISTGEFVATPENMATEQMQTLLFPEQFSGEAKPVKAAKYRIAVIPKGTTHEFWKSVHFGAQQAADELGNVEILWKGPQLESQREAQVSLVQDFITKKVDGICLAPLDSQSLVPSVAEAKQAGIPTVIFDSDLDDKDVYVSYVATDNFHGGQLAARRLAEALGRAIDDKTNEQPAAK